jgi:hypothetical protein
VVEWISERRMAEARRLLVETDESVENIGARIGYDGPTYFARRFRISHREFPAAWRRANRSAKTSRVKEIRPLRLLAVGTTSGPVDTTVGPRRRNRVDPTKPIRLASTLA